LQNIHFEAFCKEHGREYINPSFANMAKYYVSPCNLGKGIKYIFFRSVLFSTIVSRLKLLKNVISFENEKNNGKEIPLVSHDIFVDGWFFRVNELTEKYQCYFSEKYFLKETYYRKNLLFKEIISLKDDNFVIGVHVRRGDYKNWLGGSCYFDDCVYMKYMHSLEKEIEKLFNKKCKFIIFSNENTSFKENADIYISKNKWYIDHVLMTRCDFLIGPPSTFTLWASYIGRVKYYHMENASGYICLDDFKCCTG
jgi:hypothetical protein